MTSGQWGREELDQLAKPLFLDTLNLDDHSILDDHADFTVADAFNGRSNVFQVQFAGRR